MVFPSGDEESPPYPPERLTIDQLLYALSQWFLGRRLGHRAVGACPRNREHASYADIPHPAGETFLRGIRFAANYPHKYVIRQRRPSWLSPSGKAWPS